MESIKTISELNTEKKLWETPMLKTNDSEITEAGSSYAMLEGQHGTFSTLGISWDCCKIL